MSSSHCRSRRSHRPLVHAQSPADEPDRTGATLGRTATAAILPADPAFAIDTMKTRAGEHNVDEATQYSCGAVRGLLLAGCGRPRSFAELSQPRDQDDRAVSTGRPDRHHGPT